MTRWLVAYLTRGLTYQLMREATGGPKWYLDQDAHDRYQATVLQPIRDRLSDYADRLAYLDEGTP